MRLVPVLRDLVVASAWGNCEMGPGRLAPRLHYKQVAGEFEPAGLLAQDVGFGGVFFNLLNTLASLSAVN